MKTKSPIASILLLASLCINGATAQSNTKILTQPKPMLKLAEIPSNNDLFAASDIANVGDLPPDDLTAFSAHPSSEPIIIDTGNLSSTQLTEAQEDMKIMEQLLLETVGSTARQQIIASGIPLVNYLKESKHRNIFIAGTGAIFFVNVDFPLSGKREEKKITETYPKDSAWERARQKVIGTPPRNPFFMPQRLGANAAPWPNTAATYRPEKVRILKEQLVSALANATNMRTLDPDDRIWLVVTGPSETSRRAAPVPTSGLPALPSPPYSNSLHTLNPPQSTTRLTMAATKADIDDLNVGNLTKMSFLDKAGLQIR